MLPPTVMHTHDHPHVATADTVSSEQHALGRSIVLHLVPGVAMLIFAMLATRLVPRWGVPPIVAGSLGILFVLVPMELGVLCSLGWRRNGRLSLAGVVHYQQPMPLRHQLVLVPLLVIWFLVASSLWRSAVPALEAALAAVPAWILNPLAFDDGGTYSVTVLLMTALLRVICTGIIAPVAEELYFRGYLLPRLDRFGHYAVVVNVVLFACYHLWTLVLIPGRVLAWLPIVYVVWRKRNIRLGITVHVATNLLGVVLGMLSRG